MCASGSHLRVAVCWNTIEDVTYTMTPAAATFGWLCVETVLTSSTGKFLIKQPPSGGCVLKQFISSNRVIVWRQPPSGGCVLKPWTNPRTISQRRSHLRVAVCWNRIRKVGNKRGIGSHLRVAVCWNQMDYNNNNTADAATFGWLCVETRTVPLTKAAVKAATFGWLCVETINVIVNGGDSAAATFGWLCVETR